MEFTVADAVVLVIVAISALLAFSRGLTREALAIAGWVLAGFAAFFFAPLVEPLLVEAPVIGGFLRSSCTLAVLAAFAVVFAIALVLLAIFTPLVSSVVRDSALGPIDKGLGFLFGVARGILLVAVLYLLYDLMVPIEQRIDMIDNAASVRVIADTAALLQANAPDSVPDWLSTRIDRLMGTCGEAPVTAR